MRLPHVAPFSQSPRYLFTACTLNRRKILACAPAYEALTDVWTRAASLDGWYVGRYMLMPDHVHFFAVPVREAKRPGPWHKAWKGLTARRLSQEMRISSPVWQPDTFDHILRSTESYEQKWNYVRQNPVRAGLCADTEDWPWQGEIYSIAMI